jgi:hypothetical protein
VAHPLEGGSAIALDDALEPIIASLEVACPGAGAWRGLIEQFQPLGQRLVDVILSPLPPVGPPIALAVARCRDALLLTRRMMGSIETFGLDVFDWAIRPPAWLAGPAQHSGGSRPGGWCAAGRAPGRAAPAGRGVPDARCSGADSPARRG